MVEVGKDYDIWMIEDGGEGHAMWRVVDFKFPLLKLSNPYEGEQVVNMASLHFIKAVPSRHQGKGNEAPARKYMSPESPGRRIKRR